MNPIPYSLSPKRAVFPEYDYPLFWVVLTLLILGMVMVYSASIAISETHRYTGGQPTYFLTRHILFLMFSLVVSALAFQVPLRLWQGCAPWLFMLGVLLLILVLIPGIGREVNGARRWISLSIANIQPSELMKLFAVLYAADYTVRKVAVMRSFKKGFLPMAFVMVITGWLLLSEPDFGAFAVIVCIAMGVLFLGGMNGRLFSSLLILLLVSFVILIWISPYRRERITGFMNPWADELGKGYQLSHALVAFGRGEWLGVGLGSSVEKLHYLPEAHTDFLLAVIAEELGFVGVAVVICLFAWLIWRAHNIGRQAVLLERFFSGLVAQGIAIWLGMQALISMGVNMGLLPTKGLTLPLMSFGGSGILANCLAVTILLKVDWENRQLMRGYAV